MSIGLNLSRLRSTGLAKSSLEDSRHRDAGVIDTGIMDAVVERSGSSAKKHSIFIVIVGRHY